MAEYEEDVKSLIFKDRKGWLVFFGIIQTLLGGFCTIMVFFMIIGMIVSAKMGDSIPSTIDKKVFWPTERKGLSDG